MNPSSKQIFIASDGIFRALPPAIAAQSHSSHFNLSMFGSRARLYNSWVRDHYRFLFRSAWARSRSVADEVVKDCFALPWRHMDQPRDKKLAKPWLFQIFAAESAAKLGVATEVR